jgi:hypothetical protein
MADARLCCMYTFSNGGETALPHVIYCKNGGCAALPRVAKMADAQLWPRVYICKWRRRSSNACELLQKWGIRSFASCIHLQWRKRSFATACKLLQKWRMHSFAICKSLQKWQMRSFCRMSTF